MLTHHFVVSQPLCGLYWPVQTRFTDVQVLGVGVLRQVLHKSPNIHVVIVIYMTEPSMTQEKQRKD